MNTKQLTHTVLSILFAVFVSVTAFAGTQKKNTYSIKLQIKNLHDSVCYLANYYGDKQYIQDTAYLNANKEYVFEGDKELGRGMYIIAGAKKVRYFDFLIDTNPFMSIKGDTLDYVSSLKFTGSDENNRFYDYLRFIQQKQKEVAPLSKRFEASKADKDSADAIRKQMTKIDSAVNNYKENYIKSYPTTLVCNFFRMLREIEIPEAPLLANGKKDSTFAYRYYKAHYWDNIDLTDEGLLRTPILHTKIDDYFNKMLLQIPDSINKEADILIEKARPNKETFKYLVYFVTNFAESSKVMGMDASFVHMVDKYYATKQAYWVDEATQYRITDRAAKLKPILIGQSTPPLAIEDSLGKNIFLYNVRHKYTVLFFWDPDCGHCQTETPKLKEAYEKIKKDGIDVEVYAIGATNDAEKWKKFIREKKLNWINVLDQYNSRVAYDIYSTPVIYVLDENKKIIAKRIGAEQLEDFLKHTSDDKKTFMVKEHKD